MLACSHSQPQMAYIVTYQKDWLGLLVQRGVLWIYAITVLVFCWYASKRGVSWISKYGHGMFSLQIANQCFLSRYASYTRPVRPLFSWVRRTRTRLLWFWTIQGSVLWVRWYDGTICNTTRKRVRTIHVRTMILLSCLLLVPSKTVDGSNDHGAVHKSQLFLASSSARDLPFCRPSIVKPDLHQLCIAIAQKEKKSTEGARWSSTCKRHVFMELKHPTECWCMTLSGIDCTMALL